MANKEALLEALAWVEKEHEKKEAGLPSEWDQGVYIGRGYFEEGDYDEPVVMPHCDTVCCIAGHVVIAHNRVVIDELGWPIVVDGRGNEIDNISGVAQQILDLEDEQVWQLFSGYNTIEDIRNYIADFLEDDNAE